MPRCPMILLKDVPNNEISSVCRTMSTNVHDLKVVRTAASFLKIVLASVGPFA